MARGAGKRLTVSEQLEMIALYQAGENILGIVAKFGVDRKTLSNVRRRHNIPSRPMPSLKGDRHWNFKGGRSTSGKYVKILISDDDPLVAMRDHKGYEAEHRIVMARHLGRPLTKNESVHHKNGNKHDNKLENLQLRHRNHGYGQKLICADCGSDNLIGEEI